MSGKVRGREREGEDREKNKVENYGGGGKEAEKLREKSCHEAKRQK